MPEAAAPVVHAETPAAPPAVEPKAEEAKAPEAAPVIEAPKPEPKRSIAAEAAAAAQRRKEIAQRNREELKRREAEVVKREAAIKDAEEFTALAKANPLEAFRKVGLSNDQIAQLLLNDGRPDPLAEARSVRAELEALKAAQAEERRKSEESARARSLEAFKVETHGYLEENAERWELISKAGAGHMVSSRILEEYRKTGRHLDVDAVADEVEREIEAQVEQLAAAKKLQAKLAPKAAPVAPKTLSNAMTPAPGSMPAPEKLTDDERMARALKVMQLKKSEG